jgi:hypothetical protein
MAVVAAEAGEHNRLDRDFADELAFRARARRTLAWMPEHARMRVATGDQVAGDRYTAERLGRMLKSYAKERADEPDSPLYFGRLRFGAGPDADEHRNQSYYLGRRRITDETGRPLVIDWRAPVSSRFYRASARDRQGVTSRRRFGWTTHHPVRLTGFEDERLNRGEELGTASRLLTAEIRRRPAPRGVPALQPPPAAQAQRRPGGRPQPGVPALHLRGAPRTRRRRH